MADHVNHPSHYKSKSGIESIDVIEAFDLPFDLGNTVKYVLRAGRKDTAKTAEDLQKASWYLQRRIWKLSHDCLVMSFDEWRKKEAEKL